MPPRNPEQEKEVLQVSMIFLTFACQTSKVSNICQWMETVMGESLPSGDFGDILKDGVVLCKLMNKLQPGSVKKFKEKVSLR